MCRSGVHLCRLPWWTTCLSVLSKPVFANGTIPTGFLSRGTIVMLTSGLANKNFDLPAEGLRSTALSQMVNDCPCHAMLLFAEVYTKRYINRRRWCVTHHASSACWTVARYSKSPRRHYAAAVLLCVKQQQGLGWCNIAIRDSRVGTFGCKTRELRDVKWNEGNPIEFPFIIVLCNSVSSLFPICSNYKLRLLFLDKSYN